jgi:hypothetical protein
MREEIFAVLALFLMIPPMTIGIAFTSGMLWWLFFRDNEDMFKFKMFVSHIVAAILIAYGLNLSEEGVDSWRKIGFIIVFLLSGFISFLLSINKFKGI